MPINLPNVDLIKSGLRVLLKIHIDWEMCIDISHLIFEASRNSDDEIIDKCLDRS